MDEYIVIERLPTVEEYRELRSSVGWGRPDAEAARIGLAHSLYGVCILDGERVIACGRVIGDGGLCFYIQDIIVQPDYQRQGLGRCVMSKVMAYLERHVHKGGFVGLMAAKGAEDFYLRYGFIKRPTENYGPGMIRFWK